MRHPKPFAVFISGKFSFTVTAYSLDQARAIVAAMIAGETICIPSPGAGLGKHSLDGAAK